MGEYELSREGRPCEPADHLSSYIKRGELEAKPQGEGVNRAWLVSVDSLHELRFSRPADGYGPTEDREDGASDAAVATFADVLRDMAARLEQRAAEAAQLRTRLELTASAHSTVEQEAQRLTRGERASQRGAADGAGQGALGAAVRVVIFETASTTVLSARSVGPRKEEGMQAEAQVGGLREDARQLLRVSYERQVAGGGKVTQVDLGAGAEERGMNAASPRLGVLLDYMDVMGWVETDLFASDAASDTGRRITARGLAVLREA